MKKKEVMSPEEDQTYRIFPIYRRKCDLMGVSFLAYLKELLEKATEVSKFDTVFLSLIEAANFLRTRACPG